MHVDAAVKMFYDRGKAALITPITLGDLTVVFNKKVDFLLPSLTLADGAGKTSVYGAMSVVGSYADLQFKGGGTYTLNQQYQAGLNGIVNLGNGSGTIDNAYVTSVYGWVFVSGNWDASGMRNGNIPNAPEQYPSVANFFAQDMVVNYTMEGAGPDTVWGVVTLGQHAKATLQNTTLNLTLAGADDRRTAVFLGGVTLTKPSISNAQPSVAYYDNSLVLDKVTVNFSGAGSGDYITMFDVDASNTVIKVSNGSTLKAAAGSKIADRSLIYINKTLPVYPTVAGAVLDFASLDFTATDSSLSGGVYVDSADSTTGTFTAANKLTMTLNGHSDWAGNLSVSDVSSQPKHASASLTIDGAARWTGMATSQNGYITLTIQGQGIWTPTGHVVGAPFDGGIVRLDGGTIQADNVALQVSSALTLGANGGAFDSNSQTITFDGIASGDGALTKKGDGTLVLTKNNDYKGGTVLKQGELSVSSDAFMGGAGGKLTFNGGLLKVTGTTMLSTARSILWEAAGGGFDIDDETVTFTVAQDLLAGGALIKQGKGTLVLSGTNTYTGGTTVSDGTLSVSAEANLGAVSGAVTIGKALLVLSSAFSSSHDMIVTDAESTIDNMHDNAFSGSISGAGRLNKTGDGVLTLTGDAAPVAGTAIVAGTLQIGDGGGTGSLTGDVVNDGKLVFNRTGSVTFAGALTGGGTLFQSGSGTTILTGDASHAGGTTITDGKLQIGAGGSTGSLAGNITNDAVLEFNRQNDLIYSDKVTGAGSLVKTGDGKLILTGDNDYKGGTTVTAGTLQIGNNGILGSLTGNVDITGSLVFSRTGIVEFSGVLSGTGKLQQSGSGSLKLSDDSSGFKGEVGVDTGTLLVENALGGAIQVAAGATLGGKGRLTGNVSLSSAGGILWGQEGQVLTFENSLTLVAGNVIKADLGASGNAALFKVNGDLTLAGTLNITDLGGFGPGLYRLFDYTGGLLSNDLILGNVPGGSTSGMSLQTSMSNQVNLINTNGLTLNYWDGADPALHDNNKIDGGSGKWNLASDENWTDQSGIVNAGWQNDQFAYFGGAAGTVIIDNNHGGVSAAGMQFSTDGYRVEGDVLQLSDTVNNTASVIRVDSGVTATIAVELKTTKGINKTDSGTLILIGDSDYAGGTTISGGTLQIGAGDLAGSITGAVVNNGTLAFNRLGSLIMNGNISGTGGVKQLGNGVTILAGTNTYSGGTIISAGTLQIGNGGDEGTLSGDVMNNATLQFKRSGTLTMTGNITGEGSLVQAGDGTTILTGHLLHTGGTVIQSGKLQIGDGSNAGSLTGNVTNNAQLLFNSPNDLLIGGKISGTGSVLQSGNGRTVLTGENDYNGGTLVQSGTLQIGNGDSTGSISGDVTNEGILAFNRTGSLEFGGKISGSGSLLQGGKGTLILTADSNYSGTTSINSGILQIGNGGNTGSITGDVINEAVLVFNRLGELSYTGSISGTGSVVQKGDGVTIFEGENTYSGGLTVEKGVAKAGRDKVALGSGLLTVGAEGIADLNDFNVTVSGLTGAGNIHLGKGTLSLDQEINTRFSGILSGTGGITKNQSGTLILSGMNDYSGATHVNDGVLQQSSSGGFSSNSIFTIAKDGKLDFNGADTAVVALKNSGVIMSGGEGGAIITVMGDYTGNGGTVVLNTVLGSDNALTDMLKIKGSTVGTSYLQIVHRPDVGAQTTNGIKIIDVGGASDGVFTLQGDYIAKDGQPVVVGGAYAYSLHKGTSSSTDMNNWYLRSETLDPGTNPRPSAGVPVYEAFSATIQSLNQSPTLRQRVGERYFSEMAGNVDDYIGARTSISKTDHTTQNKMIWGRIESAHSRLQPSGSVSEIEQKTNIYQMQAGIDGQFYEGSAGWLVGGLTGRFTEAKSSIYSDHGDGRIDTQGWGLGGTLTWYGDNGLYIDGQIQGTWYYSDLYSVAAKKNLTADKRGFGYSLSIETGIQIDLDTNWSLTPQMQLDWSSVHFNTFKDIWRVDVVTKDNNSLNLRLGLSMDYKNIWRDENGSRRRFHLYSIANFYQDFVDSSKISVGNTNFTSARDNLWGGIGAGGTYAWADEKYSIYGEGAVNTSLQSFSENYTIRGNIGFLMKW